MIYGQDILMTGIPATFKPSPETNQPPEEMKMKKKKCIHCEPTTPNLGGRPLKPDSLRGLLDAAIEELELSMAADFEKVQKLLKAARKKVR